MRHKTSDKKNETLHLSAPSAFKHKLLLRVHKSRYIEIVLTDTQAC